MSECRSFNFLMGILLEPYLGHCRNCCSSGSDSSSSDTRSNDLGFPCCSRERTRLQTFEHLWPLPDEVTPSAMAKAGFYYTGIADRVQCAICRGILRNWEPGDIPWDEHKNYFGFCRLITGQDGSNIPIDIDNLPSLTIEELLALANPGDGMAPWTQCIRQPSQRQSYHERLQTPTVAQIVTRPQQGVIDEVDKKYVSVAARVKTYAEKRWEGCVSPVDLAEAGFYMTGEGDEVVCFECQVSLCEWKTGDDPLQAHQRFSPDCSHLRQLSSKLSLTALPPQQVQPERLLIDESSLHRIPFFPCNLCEVSGCNTVALPCGHMIYCKKCTSKLNDSLLHCSICMCKIDCILSEF